MEAIILAGGRGKRLRPVTDYVPKPLIPLNNIPILEWQIRYLKKHKIKKIVICTGYKTEMIEHFLELKNHFDIDIIISKEKKPLGTGGAIKQASKKIKEKTFFVINGDTITDINLNKLSLKKNSIAAIELRTKFGIMEVENDIIKKFHEKKEISNLWMNAGIYHFTKQIIQDLPKVGDIEKTTFPNYAKKGNLQTVKFKNVKWYSIDSYKDMEECSKQIKKIIK
ncbi:MAG: nucleotidyltransferase family protein [Nitrosopumilaceae archaeon]|nr:nucleotidyltransferase family protein [Nitrosopumilaceae archaeon]